MEYIIIGGFIMCCFVTVGLMFDKGEDTYGNQK